MHHSGLAWSYDTLDHHLQHLGRIVGRTVLEARRWTPSRSRYLVVSTFSPLARLAQGLALRPSRPAAACRARARPSHPAELSLIGRPPSWDVRCGRYTLTATGAPRSSARYTLASFPEDIVPPDPGGQAVLRYGPGRLAITTLVKVHALVPDATGYAGVQIRIVGHVFFEFLRALDRETKKDAREPRYGSRDPAEDRCGGIISGNLLVQRPRFPGSKMKIKLLCSGHHAMLSSGMRNDYEAIGHD